VEGKFDPHSIGLSAFRNIDFQSTGSIAVAIGATDTSMSTLLGRPAGQMAASGDQMLRLGALSAAG
jgi:hypothetical protein